jgi:hypothetical protein
MPAIHFLVDCDGQTLLSPFQMLRQGMPQGIAEHALITRAVEKLGYVHVQEWPRGLLVFYRRPITSPVALAGVIYLLADLADKRVIFSVNDGHARYSLCHSRTQAIGRLAREMRDLEAGSSQTDRASPDVDRSSGRERYAAKRNTT